MPVEDSLTCKMNVLYIGSSVPMETSEGLDAIQQPLKEHYPIEDGATIDGMKSTLTVLPTGLQLLLNDDESGTIIWFPITSLSLCAAVRCIHTINTATGEKLARFVSLSSPAAQGPNAKRPAIFTAITRRTKGKKVLECHGFVCESARDALELVQKTSAADKLSKQRLNGSTVHSNPSFGLDNFVKSPPTTSYSSNTLRESTLSRDYPVRLIPGERPATSNGVAPEFLDSPPEHGYFYSTKNSKVKKYTVDPVSDTEDYLNTSASPSMLVGRPSGDRRSVYSQPVAMSAGHPMASMTLPHAPRQNTIIPIHAIPPQQVMYPQPRVMSPPPLQIISPPPGMVRRGRFFSPPPPPHFMRPRLVAYPRHDPHVFVPPPPVYIDAPYVIKRRPTRRGSHSSEGSGSSGSDSPRHLHDETLPKRLNHNHDNGDLSSELSSRPRTPPTDYDARNRGYRLSRREDFEIRQRPPFNGISPPHPSYVVYGPRYPHVPMYMERTRSLPPNEDRGRGKKEKKSKLKKKDKKGKKKVFGIPSDSTDSYSGYVSENQQLLDRSYPRLPRDFRKKENMNMSERAFSQNLQAQSRNSTGYDQSGVSAYNLNEHMASKVHGEEEFHMY